MPFLIDLQELRDKGGLDETRRKNLDDGIAAARSILARANEAIHKEQRLNAVNDLQQRVEDWKGHKIDHFGELLLYGNYTVLKGEGAKEVEREVSTIFGSLVAMSREQLRSVLGASQRPCPPAVSVVAPRSPSFASSYTVCNGTHSRAGTPTAGPMEFPPMGTTSSPSQGQGMKLSTSESTPDLQASRSPSHLNLQSLKRFKTYKKLSHSEPPSPTTHHSLRKSPSHSEMSSRVASLFMTRSPKAGPSPPSFKVPDATPFPNIADDFFIPPSKLNTIAESKVLLPHASTHVPTRHTNLPFSKKTPMRSDTRSRDNLIIQMADGSAFTSPQREQYKVYLFERILLCCKEINLNKPKNKMLGTNKPLVDKKGQPKLQLKGRIFMQNVTDVLTFSKIGK